MDWIPQIQSFVYESSYLVDLSFTAVVQQLFVFEGVCLWMDIPKGCVSSLNARPPNIEKGRWLPKGAR